MRRGLWPARFSARRKWKGDKIGACPSNGSRCVSSAGRSDARRGDAGDVVHIAEESTTPQTAARRRNPLGSRHLRRDSALLRPRSTAEGTTSTSRLDSLASGRLRVRAHYSDRLLGFRIAIGGEIPERTDRPYMPFRPEVVKEGLFNQRD